MQGGKEHVVPEADNSVWPYRTTLPDNGRDNVRSRKVMRVPSPSHSEVLTEQPSVTAPDVATDRPVSRSKPLSNRRGVADEQNTEQEIFISHRWSKPEQRESNKRIRTPRNLTSVSVLGDVSRLAQSEAEELAPESYAEAVKSKEWRESMMAEIKALMNRGCWRVVRTPQGVRLIKSKYVYKIKKDWNGRIVKRKSRLVVQGFSQVEGVDYNETYAPVAKATTFRLMLALSKIFGLHLHQLDVDSAFPYADLEEDVYMTPVPGMDILEGFCLKLLKSLYGLKQAPRNWNKNIVKYIKSLGFTQCVLDNCLFVKRHGEEIYLISLYVDDILVAGSNLAVVEAIKEEFTQNYGPLLLLLSVDAGHKRPPHLRLSIMAPSQT